MKIFIYPTYDAKRDKSGNRYIEFFREAFSSCKEHTVINRFPRSETLGLLLNPDADIYILHWVDLIPSKPLGRLQEIFFRIGVKLTHLRGKKIVWVLHNKAAHDDLSDRPGKMMRFMAGYADAVLTHSSEGVSFFKEKYPESEIPCIYIPIPAYSQECFTSDSAPIYDYIIWGSISRRKNILEFVRFAASNEYFKDKKILVCGRCGDPSYDKELREFLPPCIEYRNEFFSDAELKSLISSSRVILFTYSERSVLSSGALIYSLNFAKPIIGPRVGSFADMSDIVACYDDFSEIPSLKLSDGKAALDFIRENTWESFPEKFTGSLDF